MVIPFLKGVVAHSVSGRQVELLVEHHHGYDRRDDESTFGNLLQELAPFGVYIVEEFLLAHFSAPLTMLFTHN
jgi:hypothetical protein